LGGWGLPRGKPYRHPVGKRNELVCCLRVTWPAEDLHTIPHGSPSHDFMRASQKYMREIMCSLPPTAM
jgi:hypothetical protein